MKQKKKRSQYVVSGLIDFLEEIGEDNLLPDIADSLKSKTNDKEIKEAKVVSARILTDQQKKALAKIILNLFQVDLPIVNTIDKKLIGGFTVNVEDWYLDASLRQEIKKLKDRLLS